MGRRIALPLFFAALCADLVTKTLAVAYDREVYFHDVAGELPKRLLMSAIAIVAAVVLSRRSRHAAVSGGRGARGSARRCSSPGFSATGCPC